ncbi:MAG: hypothetical protein WCT07_01625 [Candidatus Paceibacterota bacterium]
MDLPEKEESALDTAEHELYDPKKKIEDMSLHHVRDRRASELPTSWGEDAPIIKKIEEEEGFSFGAKFLLVSSIILLGALSFTAWRVLSSRNVVSSANIDMTSEITPYIEGGEATPLILTLQNRNTSPLQEVSLTLMYKKGTGAQDEEEKVIEKRDLGTINANDYKRQEFEVTLYGSESESRDITMKLEYKVAGSAAVFSKVTTTTVVLKTPPISVRIDGPDTLSIGQNGTFTITIKNNTATTSLSSLLQLDIPNTFTLESSDPKPSARGTVWSIPQLNPSEIKTITLLGSVYGSQGSVTTIKAQIGSREDSLNNIGVVYSSQTFDVHTRTSPLALSVSLDTDRGVSEALRYGDRTTLNITYKNNSDIQLHNIKLKLSVSGDAALYKQINPDIGYYDSQAQTITWDKATISGLETLAPNAEGMVRVIIPIALKGISSPTLKISFTGVGTAQETDDVVASISKSWVVQGSANISASTFYKNSPFQNMGPIPPQPNNDTTYTAHIAVSAQNALVNTSVSFILPVYVTWRGVTSDNANISYNANTRTVTWSINKIEAGKTVSSDIGISVRPSQSHVGQSPAITSGIVLDADEEVSKAHIRTTLSALNTFISGENWATDPSRVVGSQ